MTQSEKYYVNSTSSKNGNAIFSDGSGYYSYLPATFIYKDYRFQFLYEVRHKYNDMSYINGNRIDAKEGEIVDKYYIGTAVLISPFFIANCLKNQVKKGNFGDGYDNSFQKMVRISSLFYFLLGIIGLILFLKTYLFSNFTISGIVLGLSLGTSLNFYSVYYPSFSHVYSFFAIAWFFYFARKLVLDRKSKYLIFTCIFIGLIAIIRPTNLLVVLIFPFLFQDWGTFLTCLKEFVRYRKKTLVFASLVFLSLIFLQLINIYLQTNQWNPNTYTSEKFEFLSNPKIPEVLLGYRKGLLTYAPFFFLLIPGLIVLYRRNRYLFWGWLLVFVLNTYLIASWWCWWYGGGFGMRPFVDLSVFLILPIAYFLASRNKIVKGISFTLVLCSLALYQVFQVQFNANIIDYEKMTATTYWQSFLNTSPRFAWQTFYKDEALPKSNLVAKHSYFYEVKSMSWKSHATSADFSFAKQEVYQDIQLHLIPNHSSKNELAFEVSADVWIGKYDINPGLIFVYFKNGREIKRRDFSLGSRIPKSKQFATIKLQTRPFLTNSQVDSIHVIFNRHLYPTAIRNLKVDYLQYELKK